MFGTAKTIMVWLKKFDDMLNPFDRIRDSWTDILRQHSPHYAWHRVVKSNDFVNPMSAQATRFGS